jgi:hypothetical protein
VKQTHWSKVLVRANHPSIYFILQTLYFDIVPQSLDYSNPAVLTDAQDVRCVHNVKRLYRKCKHNIYQGQVAPCTVPENVRGVTQS